MKHPNLKFLFLGILMGALTPLAIGSPLSDAEEAFRAGDYEKAARDFQTALSVSPPSAALYYNLGMALRKAGDAGGAALNFRRALLLAPRMADARMALSDVERAQGIPLGTSDWRSWITDRFPLAVLLHPGFLLLWVGAFGFLVSAFRSWRPGLWMGGVCALVGALLFAAGSLADPRLIWSRGAVVTSPEGATLLASPAERSGALGSLPAGYALHSAKIRGQWAWVSIGGGRGGWVPATTITPLVPSE